MLQQLPPRTTAALKAIGVAAELLKQILNDSIIMCNYCSLIYRRPQHTELCIWVARNGVPVGHPELATVMGAAAAAATAGCVQSGCDYMQLSGYATQDTALEYETGVKCRGEGFEFECGRTENVRAERIVFGDT